MISNSQKISSLLVLTFFLASTGVGHSENAPGEELTGDRAWRGEIRTISTHNRANDRKTRRGKGKTDRQLAEAHQMIAELKKKLDAMIAERAQFQLRIEAGDLAGADLEAELVQARELAAREHEYAEKVSAEILEQVEAQKAIVKSLKETISQFDPDERARLIGENEKLSKSLKEAWARAKEVEAALAAAKKKQAGTRELEERLVKVLGDQRALQGEAKAMQAKLQSALDSQHAMRKKIDELAAATTAAEELAVQHRAEALRERIFRKRLEVQLEDAQQAAQRAAAKEAAEKAKLLKVEPIYFGVNRIDSLQQEKRLIEKVTAILKAHPSARLSIIGHTCSDGTPTGNLALSQRRAKRVADLLKINGIPASAIAGVEGKGQSNPVADNSTHEGRETNRRVEVNVLLE